MVEQQTVSKCPFAHGDKRLQVGNQYQPFEQYGMREFFQMAAVQAPVAYNEEIGYYIVSNRKDVMTILRDVKNFSASVVLQPVTPVDPAVRKKLDINGYCPLPVQVSADRPDHPRIRKVVAEAFDCRGVENLRPHIQEIVNNCINNIKGKGTIDIIDDFAYDLPALVICRMLGIEDKDVPKIKNWSDNRLEFVFGNLTPEQQNVASDNLIDFWNFCKDLVVDRMQNPKDDYASFLLEKRNGDDSILTLDEITSLNFGVLLAGHETTTNMTANAVYTLMQNRHAWEAICNDPSLIPNAIEECLRINGSVVCWRRLALNDVEFSGTTIPKGSKVLVTLAGANLDSETFENPDVFDIHRKNAKRHVTFGHGSHICIGADIAREELKIILERLTVEFPDMMLVNDQVLDYIKTISFRGPRYLMVNLNE